MLSIKELKTVLTPWLGLSEDFDPSPFAGFLYLITDLRSGRQYLGKKVFWFNRRHKIKGRKNRKKVTSESDWKYYKGSSDEVLQGIRRYGIEGYRFEILSLHKTRGEVNYSETKELFKRDVLFAVLPDGTYTYYNKNIMGRYFRGKPKEIS